MRKCSSTSLEGAKHLSDLFGEPKLLPTHRAELLLPLRNFMRFAATEDKSHSNHLLSFTEVGGEFRCSVKVIRESLDSLRMP